MTFLQFFQLLCFSSVYTWGKKRLSASVLKTLVPKGLICLDFEDPKSKSWLIFQKCHYGNDIWPQMELNRCQKLFSTSVINWTEAKNCFLPQVELNRCQKLFYASVKNWTEAKRFVRVQKSQITFFLLLPRMHVLSLSHPPSLLLLRFDHSRLLDVWLIRVLAWRSAIWDSQSGLEFVVLQVRGRLVFYVDRDLLLMVVRCVGGGSV